VPAIAKLVKVADGVPVAFTVNVVLMTAAGTAAQTSSAKAKLENVRLIGLLESSTLETQEFRETWLMRHNAGPHPAG
jgi:Na+-transporting NADH:ubiquinone oxidoreductase subunit NqrA